MTRRLSWTFKRRPSSIPSTSQARLNKAVVYLDCGDYKHARAELEKRRRDRSQRRRGAGRAGRRRARRRQARPGARGLRARAGHRARLPAGALRPRRPLHGLRQGPGQGEGLPHAVPAGGRQGRSAARRRGGAPQGAASDARRRCAGSWRSRWLALGAALRPQAAPAKPARRHTPAPQARRPPARRSAASAPPAPRQRRRGGERRRQPAATRPAAATTRPPRQDRRRRRQERQDARPTPSARWTSKGS